jgi:dTDP-4-amino-4,6-dideoxygalactose transaminase
MSYSIPFNRPCLAGNEYNYIAQAIANGHASGDGLFTRRCHELLERELGVLRALLTTSCTHALELAALLLDCDAGDEIIVPSYTFVSSANAFALRGSRIVFCDIRPDTLNLDERCLESLISAETKAVVPVHYAGVPCAMDRIMEVCRRHGISVVEDNAHALFARFQGRYTGTFGCLAAQSFHETKNFTCGEGGALIINDRDLVERAIIMRDKGTDRRRFFQGMVDKYTWQDIGSSYLPSDLLAAFLHAQLEARDVIQKKRQRVWNFYAHHLRQWAQETGARLPLVPDDCEQAYHMFYIVLPTSDYRDELISHLESNGILSVFHYVPLHLSLAGKKFAARECDCPVAEEMSARLLRLPFYTDITPHEQGRVVAAVKSYQPRQTVVAVPAYQKDASA